MDNFSPKPAWSIPDAKALKSRLLRLGQWLLHEIRDMGMTLLVFIPCWLVFTTFVYELRSIPSESMTPALQVGDRVAVSKFAYGYSAWSLPFGMGKFFASGKPDSDSKRLFGSMPERGDVVIFRHPNDDKVMIKRLIGLPGDTVQIRDGKLYLNDQAVSRELRRLFTYVPYSGEYAHGATEYQETLPDGANHTIYEFSNDHPYDNTPVFRVPDGHFFMMGDSRDNSEDSRAPSGHLDLATIPHGNWNRHIPASIQKATGIGFVPLNHLIGRGDTVLFSFHRCSKNPSQECPKGRVWRPLTHKGSQ